MSFLNPMSPLTLLFGMPRSGTTWIGKIFDSHEDTLYRHESDDHGLLNFMPMFPTAADDDAARSKLGDFVSGLWARREEKVVDSLPLFRKSYLSSGRYALRHASVLARKVAPTWVEAMPGPRFYEQLRDRGTRMVWKSIESLGRIGTISRLIPHANGLVILRHPCGFVASTLRGESGGKFEGDGAASQDWPLFTKMLETPAARGAGMDVGTVRAMTEVERLALKWALYCEHAAQEVAGIDQIMPVRYEDVCFDPHATVDRLFSHCGLLVGAQTRRFVDYSVSRNKSGYYSVVKDPRRSATKWQSELTPTQINEIFGVTKRFGVGRHYPE